MGREIRFTVDHQEVVGQTSRQRVADLLLHVHLTADQADLITPDGVAHSDADEVITVQDGDALDVRLRKGKVPRSGLIDYEVNGERQATRDGRLAVGVILERAGRAASIDTSCLGDYYLQDLKTGHRYEGLNEEVIVHDGDRFLAVHGGATPVA